jgi:hypothetical protein
MTPKEEFQALAERMQNSLNPYYGLKQVAETRQMLAASGNSPDERVKNLIRLSTQLTRVGEDQEAAQTIDEAVGIAESTPALANRLPAIHFYRSIAYLRLSEVNNCIALHNRECCVFPLQGGGVHPDPGPAIEARRSFQVYLSMRPDDTAALWVTNILAMALGDYPHAMLPDHLVPPTAFTSEYDIGRFTDIALELGVDALNLAGGSLVEDFTGDGLLDIVTTTWDVAGPAHFYVNQGDGSFADQSEASGFADQLGGLNCVGGDYDNDGDVDVLILRGAWSFKDGRMRNSLMRNNGDGTFTDVTWGTGLAQPAYPTQTATWADFDNDGDLDLFVGNEADVNLYESKTNPEGPRGWDNYPNQLYRNEGDGKFVDVAAAAGVAAAGFAKGVAAGDYDNDGDVDVYVSNLDGKNNLFRNNGDWTFTDVAAQARVTEPDGRSFATWFFDYDNDGNLDLFVAGYQASNADMFADARGLPHNALLPCLYRNNGDGTFTNKAVELGLNDPYSPMGANFGDLDNDGYLDMFLTTGDPDFRSLVPNAMLRNDAGQRFQNVTTSGGFGNLQKGHGVSFADLDNDGDQDIYHEQGGAYPGDRYHNALYLNPGHGNRYLVVRLTGTASNKTAVGARIAVAYTTADGPRNAHRVVGLGSSFGGSPLRQEVGLGQAEAIETVTIRWPSGAEQVVTGPPLDSMIHVTEGQDGFELVERASIALAVKEDAALADGQAIK